MKNHRFTLIGSSDGALRGTAMLGIWLSFAVVTMAAMLAISAHAQAAAPDAVTSPATFVVPTGGQLNGSVNPNGADTSVQFAYSPDPGLAGAQVTAIQNVGAGTTAVAVSAVLTELAPRTTYYFRVVSSNADGGASGAILSFTTNVVSWGGAGSEPATGVLDSTLIPTTGTHTFTNVNGQGYDMVFTTSNLNDGGGASYFGDPGWWFEGGGPSYGYGTVTVRFYVSGTNTPIAVSGVDFRLLDAETNERFRSFGYWDAANSLTSVVYGSGILTFSHTPAYHLSDDSYDNGAPRESGDQMGKWIELNLSNIAITGFTFQAHRQTSSAGSVTMTDLITPFPAWRVLHFGSNFNPAVADDFYDADTDGSLNLVEYFYGTDPNVANVPGPLQLSVPAGKLTVTFPRDTGATDATATVQGADSASGPWENLARSINGAAFAPLIPGVDVSESGNGAIRTVHVSDVYSVGDPAHLARFLRLQVVH